MCVARMNVYIDVYMCLCVCVHVSMCPCLDMPAYPCVYHMCICVCLCTNAYTGMYIDIGVRSMYVCEYLNMRVCTSVSL